MLEHFYKDVTAVESLRCAPLGSHLDSFAASLLDLAYADSTARWQLRLVADFCRCLARDGILATAVDGGLVDAYADERRRQGLLRRGQQATLARFVDHLRDKGVIPSVEPRPDESPVAGLLHRYETHLRAERGLTTATVDNYGPFVRDLLTERFGTEPLRLPELGPADVSSFVLRRAHSMSPGRAQLMVTALRSFFRFLLRSGEIEADLAACVPAVANWRLASVPKYLEPEQVERLLDGCDRSTSTGRRDYAILLLPARLGFRAGEVVALSLDDIDWRAGEITVPGKGLIRDRLPMPTDVGEALVDYVQQDRPRCSSRRVFLCMKAPRRGFAGPSSVTTIVRRALERVSLDPPVKGAHILRHSLATGMLRSGASMREIGELLRHRHPATTEIYAKVDFASLRGLAQPWPGSGGGR